MDITFANPAWAWGLLLLLPPIAARVRSHLQSARTLAGLVSPRLQGRLIRGSSHSQRWAVFVLQCLALAGIVAALARPQFGFEEIETESEGRNLILAIDTSRSMLATDLPPDRLTRAKLAAKDIVLSLPEDRVGLIAFAGRPFLQAPLTVDHDAVLESLDQLDTEIIPRGGTNLTAAAELALETFAEAELDQSALVIFSDGEALEGAERIDAVREKAAEAGMTVIAVGVGTADGSIIAELDERGQPLRGVFVRDEAGQVVRTRLDPATLQALASQGGTYVHLGGQASLTRVVEQIRRSLSASREKGETRVRPLERFMWPLGFSAFCFVLAHLIPMLWLKPRRRQSAALLGAAGRTTVAVGIALVLSPPARAEDGLWAGHDAFEEGNYDAAIRAYEGALSERPSKKDRTRLAMAIGAAAFRKGDYEHAAESYGRALVRKDAELQEQAHYNLGNTLFRQGEAGLRALQKPANPDAIQALSGGSREVIESTIVRWKGAIEHYESALALNDRNQKASHNIEVVRKRLEELQEEKEKEEEQEEEEEEKDQEKDKEKDEEEEDESESDSEEDENGQDPSGQEPSDQEQEEQGEQPGQDEKDPEKNEDPEQSGDSENESDRQPDGDDSDQPEPQKPEGQPDEPEDGELEADPNQEQPDAPPPSASEDDRAANPETGYSPGEARQLLDALADETDVRPVLAPARSENYKNW
ncbi:MAG: VWA domain-containing protein [Verrucomicrobiales bacterium]